MDATLPWDAWVSLVVPYYPDGKRGRKPIEIEQMLRMTMLQTWFNLSDEGIEYLKYILSEIPKHMDDTDLSFLDDLLPWSDAIPAICRKNVQ